MLAVYAVRMLARNLSTSARSVSACLPSVSAALWTWLIVSGGFNIFPREVEEVLSQHADVAMVAVVGVPDDKWGERPKAFVLLRAGHSATPQELIAHVRTKIASFKAPRDIVFTAGLPKTSTGKIQKFVLRDAERAGRTHRV